MRLPLYRMSSNQSDDKRHDKGSVKLEGTTDFDNIRGGGKDISQSVDTNKDYTVHNQFYQDFPRQTVFWNNNMNEFVCLKPDSEQLEQFYAWLNSHPRKDDIMLSMCQQIFVDAWVKCKKEIENKYNDPNVHIDNYSYPTHITAISTSPENDVKICIKRSFNMICIPSNTVIMGIHMTCEIDIKISEDTNLAKKKLGFVIQM